MLLIHNYLNIVTKMLALAAFHNTGLWVSRAYPLGLLLIQCC